MTTKKEDVVRWFALDEGEGLDTADSKTGDVFTLYREDSSESPWGSPGKVGAAMFYRPVGFNDTFAILDEKPLPYSGSWAIHCWLKPEPTQESNSGWPVSRWNDVAGDREWAFSYRTATHASGAGLLFRARFLDAGSTEQSVVLEWSGTGAEEGVWSFVAWDRGTSTLKLFANGVERDSVVIPGTGPHDLVEASGASVHLSFFQPYGFDTGNRYRGEIDEVAFFAGRTFGQDDAEWLYNEGNGRSYISATTQPPTPEEIFRATFADAFGRDPQPTALRVRSDARALAGHNVINYLYPPDYCRRTMYIRLEERELLTEGSMHWFKNERDPQFWMGRWAQIQGVRDVPDPTVVDLLLRIDDNPLSFIEP